jgi:hypothetical protein
MPTTKTNETPATKGQPKRPTAPDGKSELPTTNLGFPSPPTTDPPVGK